ncbi:MAG: histidine kinase, partial [Anaerolineae bacterium]|nr:histidine kinase [Anaerolineae bacterium]
LYPIGFVCISSGIFLFYTRFRDILENDRRRQIAAALEQTRKANDALEQANTDLIKANNLATESARLKSEFMSTMSHELRTPLNAMLGFCGILLEGMGGEIDADARHMIERVNSNSSRLLNLINEVLDLAKIEAGRMEMLSRPFSPRALSEQWQSQMHVLAQQKGLSLDVEVDPALPDTIYGDADRITQIVINLLSNAFKFTEKGGVRLELKREDSDWIIRVIDTGVGIPPHAINYIFDEFRQVDGSSRRVYGGTGLGLAIVRNLCLMMKGNVKVTSELNKGSVFTVTLPCITSEPTEVALAS